MKTFLLAAGGLAAMALFIVALAAPAQTADSLGRHAIKGVGTLGCDEYVIARQEKSNLYYALIGWLDGYVTALNQASPDTYDVASFEATSLLAALIDGNCRSNLGARFYQVVEGIAIAIEEDRVRDASPVVEATLGDQTVKLYKETLRRVQARLAKAGYDPGAADGAFGPKTGAALTAFQRANGLAETGLPDQLTLLQMFRPGAEPVKAPLPKPKAGQD